MDQDLLVNKLLLNIREFDVSVKTALEQAYAGGYDARGVELSAHHKKEVIQFNKEGVEIAKFNRVTEAAKKIRCRVAGLYSSIQRGTVTKKGYTWKYADNGDDQHQ
jgi:hypothetical protein